MRRDVGLAGHVEFRPVQREHAVGRLPAVVRQVIERRAHRAFAALGLVDLRQRDHRHIQALRQAFS
jgi:hypothetical protein